VIRLEPAPGVELLDDPAAEPALVCTSLRNIGRANRWFGGAAAVRYGLERALAGGTPGARWTMVDVGTGMGDLPRMAAAWASTRGLVLEPLGLERHTGAARMARSLGLPVLVGDAAALPFASRSIDLVLLSQVAHHFSPGAIVHLFRECNRVARRAVIVADLRRSTLAALGFRMVGRLLGFDHHTMRDGVTSLRRGFSTASLGELLGQAGIRAPVARRPGARLVAVWHPEV
jgi:ubiquinone/menaquinone biosynthesis C-methylase UbiE